MPESSGKTTLTLHAIAEAQRRPDAHSSMRARARHPLPKPSVDTEKLLVSQPDTGEQASRSRSAVRSARSSRVTTRPALTPKAEIKANGDQQHGASSSLMSQALRKLTAVTHKTQTTLIFINQSGNKIGVIFGSPETTTGQCIEVLCIGRIDVRRSAPSRAGRRTSRTHTAMVVKNKVRAAFTEAEFRSDGEGSTPSPRCSTSPVGAGIAQKSGAYLSFGTCRSVKVANRSILFVTTLDVFCPREPSSPPAHSPGSRREDEA